MCVLFIHIGITHSNTSIYSSIKTGSLMVSWWWQPSVLYCFSVCQYVWEFFCISRKVSCLYVVYDNRKRSINHVKASMKKNLWLFLYDNRFFKKILCGKKWYFYLTLSVTPCPNKYNNLLCLMYPTFIYWRERQKFSSYHYLNDINHKNKQACAFTLSTYVAWHLKSLCHHL